MKRFGLLLAASSLLPMIATPVQAAGAPAPKEIFRKSGTGDWKGAPVVIAVAPTSVSLTLDCDRGEFNFLTLRWNGYPEFDIDSHHIEPAYGEFDAKGESTLYPSEKNGYWEVTTQAHCSWEVVATQG